MPSEQSRVQYVDQSPKAVLQHSHADAKGMHIVVTTPGAPEQRGGLREIRTRQPHGTALKAVAASLDHVGQPLQLCGATPQFRSLFLVNALKTVT